MAMLLTSLLGNFFYGRIGLVVSVLFLMIFLVLMAMENKDLFSQNTACAVDITWGAYCLCYYL